VVVRKHILRHLKNSGKKTQNLACYIVVNVAVESLNLGILVLNELRVRTLMFRNEFEDVVAFPVVSETWELLNGTKRTVAIVVALLNLSTILQFLFFWQIQYLLAKLELTVNVLFSKAEVCHVEKA
jgi:hypothetical protein